VTPAAVRQALRALFSQWGLPGYLRVDNGFPWGSQADLPPALALWLWGLAVEVIWNPPHHPQANGKVERGHGILQAWAEPEQCRSVAELQAHLDAAVQLQREEYPAVGGQSRAAIYPCLAKGGHRYSAAREVDIWDVGAVYAHLERGCWQRRVSEHGQISLYNRPILVGQQYRRQIVAVRFSGQGPQWIVSDDWGREVVERPAPELAAERILALEVMAVRPRTKHRGET
jgi:hypothetical protein